jgi:hypothetical protein
LADSAAVRPSYYTQSGRSGSRYSSENRATPKATAAAIPAVSAADLPGEQAEYGGADQHRQTQARRGQLSALADKGALVGG